MKRPYSEFSFAGGLHAARALSAQAAAHGRQRLRDDVHPTAHAPAARYLNFLNSRAILGENKSCYTKWSSFWFFDWFVFHELLFSRLNMDQWSGWSSWGKKLWLIKQLCHETSSSRGAPREGIESLLTVKTARKSLQKITKFFIFDKVQNLKYLQPSTTRSSDSARSSPGCCSRLLRSAFFSQYIYLCWHGSGVPRHLNRVSTLFALSQYLVEPLSRKQVLCW